MVVVMMTTMTTITVMTVMSKAWISWTTRVATLPSYAKRHLKTAPRASAGVTDFITTALAAVMPTLAMKAVMQKGASEGTKKQL